MRERGITTILVENVMQQVMAIADRITVLSFGEKIAEGTPQQVRANPMVVDAYLSECAHAEA